MVMSRELLMKERIRSFWEQILSYMKSFYFEINRGPIEENSLPLMCITFSAFWLRHWSCVAQLVIFFSSGCLLVI